MGETHQIYLPSSLIHYLDYQEYVWPCPLCSPILGKIKKKNIQRLRNPDSWWAGTNGTRDYPMERFAAEVLHNGTGTPPPRTPLHLAPARRLSLQCSVKSRRVCYGVMQLYKYVHIYYIITSVRHALFFIIFTRFGNSAPLCFYCVHFFKKSYAFSWHLRERRVCLFWTPRLLIVIMIEGYLSIQWDSRERWLSK